MKLLKFSFVILAVGLQSIVFGQNKIENTLKERGEAVISIDVNDLTKIPNLENLSLDHNPIRNERAFFYVNEKHYAKFKALGIDVQSEPIPSLKNEIKMAHTVLDAKEWDTYPSYSAYLDMMEQFTLDYPELCKLDTIGYSIENRLILALKISDNVDTDETTEPEFFYTSSMHGDELVGYVLMLRLVDYMLTNYESDDRIKNMIDNIEIYINPLANPDGTFASGNSTVSGATRYNANGVDLNRNFPCVVGGNNPDGNSTQKENLEMMAYMQNRDFKLSMNHHGGAEVMNYPWDHTYDRHPDDDWFIFISREYADTVHVVDPYYMSDFNDGITHGADWYRVEGGRQDYTTHFLHGREITSELSNVKLPSASQLPGFWDKNYRSLLNYIEQVMYGVSGTVTNESGNPVLAKVFIDGHDDDSSHIWADTDGYYHRLLEEGTHAITYMADGYLSQTINVSIDNYERTTQNVVLEYYVPPITVSLSTESDNPTNDNPIVLTVEFSDAVTGFEANDLSLTNASAGNLQEVQTGIIYTVDITPINNGTVMISLPEDAVDGGNEPSNSVFFVFDNTAPVNTIFDITELTETSCTANAKFNEGGTLYFAGGLFEGALPDPEMVIAGTDFEYSDVFTMGANEVIDLQMTGLNSGWSYGMFLVAVDALGNISEVYSKGFQTVSYQTEKAAQFNVYPNPAKNTIYLSSQDNITNLNIFGIDGKRYELEYNTSTNGVYGIDISKFEPGIYFISGDLGKNTFSRKVIIE